MPELTQLESGKSIIRYLPPNGTAGLATFFGQHIQTAAAAACEQHGYAFFFPIHVNSPFSQFASLRSIRRLAYPLCVSLLQQTCACLFRTAGCGYCLVCRYGNRFFGGFRNCLGSGACHRFFGGFSQLPWFRCVPPPFSGLCNGFGAGLGYGLLGCAGNGLGAGFRNCLGRAGALYRFLGSRGFAASISALVRRLALALPLKNSTPKRGIFRTMDCS